MEAELPEAFLQAYASTTGTERALQMKMNGTEHGVSLSDERVYGRRLMTEWLHDDNAWHMTERAA